MTHPTRTIIIDGEELIALRSADYEALLARAGDDVAEDAMTRRIASAAASDEAFPMELFDRIDAGESPVKVLREHRRLKQSRLAYSSGVAQSYLSEIESRAKPGSASALRKLAKALEVPLEMLTSVD